MYRDSSVWPRPSGTSPFANASCRSWSATPGHLAGGAGYAEEALVVQQVMRAVGSKTASNPAPGDMVRYVESIYIDASGVRRSTVLEVVNGKAMRLP